MIKVLLICSFSCLLHLTGFSQFTPNGGQWPDHVLFQSQHKNITYFIEKDGITIDVADPLSSIHPSIVSQQDDSLLHHAIKIKWIKTVFNGEIINSTPSSGVYNYLVGPVENHVSNLQLVKGFELQDVWPGVNIRFQETVEGLKYDYVIANHGSLDSIVLEIEGANKVQLVKEDLHISTQCGTLIERIPESWSSINNERTPISVHYELNGTEIRLSNKDGINNSMIVDPTLQGASYVGAIGQFNGQSVGMGSDYTDSGEMIGTSYNSGQSDYPITLGVYSSQYNNNIGITKFNQDLTELVWSTELGGLGNHGPLATYVADESIVLLLQTTCPLEDCIGALPQSAAPLCETDADESSTFFLQILVLNTSASEILYSRVIGNYDAFFGNQLDQWGARGRADIALAADGNYVITATAPNNNFPITEGAYDNDNFSENEFSRKDAVLFKISPDLETLHWSTFYGGDWDEVGYSIEINDEGTIYLGGSTRFDSSPSPFSEGAWKSTLTMADRYSGFIAAFSDDGEFIAATAVDFEQDFINDNPKFGIGDSESVQFLELDPEGNVWAYGYVKGNESDIPVSEGVYFDTLGSGFICKFSPDLSELLLSTRVGFDYNLDYGPTAFMIDNCGYIYTSAQSATTGMITSANLSEDALQDSGGFYLAVYEPDMAGLHYATCFGGDHIDGSHSKFDKKGVVYQSVCVPPYESFFEPTAGAWSETQQASYELGVYKIDFESQATTASFSYQLEEENSCPPFNITVENYSTEGNYSWLLDGEEIAVEDGMIEITEGGVHHIALAVFNEASCNQIDTLLKTINLPLIPEPEAVFSSDVTGVCDETLTVAASSSSTNAPQIAWFWNNELQEGAEFALETNVPGTYELLLIATDTICFYQDSLLTMVDYFPIAFEFDTMASDSCSIPVLFEGTIITDDWNGIEWTVNNGFYSNDASIFPEFEQGQHSVELIVSNPFCPSETVEWSFSALGTVQAELVSPLTTTFCLGEEIDFIANLNQGTPSWLIDGTTYASEQVNNTTLSEGTWNALFIATDAASCNVADSLLLLGTMVAPPTPSFEVLSGNEDCPEVLTINATYTGTQADQLIWQTNGDEISNANVLSYTYEDEGEFLLELSAINLPCEPVSSSELITVNLVDPIEWFNPLFPNVVSPNYDLSNDCYFLIHEEQSTEYVTDFSIEIWNRWGAQVYFSDEPAFRWCPFEDLEEGTYYLIVNYFDICKDETVSVNQTVMVVR